MLITHDAFISYSHRSDRELGPAIEKALERLAKPLLKLRACDVFLDRTSLGADPSVWRSILSHLEGSRWLLLLASPEAATSPWCNQELDWWLAHRGPERLLILVTAGTLHWDGQAGDFDWTRTTALPKLLSGRLADEPLYIDLRDLPRNEPLSLRSPAFREAMVSVAAPLRGVRKDELDSEDLRMLRRNQVVGGGLLAAAAAAVIFGGWQAVKAERAGAVEALLEGARTSRELDPARSLLQALVAQRLGARGPSTLVIVDTLAAHPRQVRHVVAGGLAPAPKAAAVGMHAGSNLIAIAQCADDPPAANCQKSRLHWQRVVPSADRLPDPVVLEVQRVDELTFSRDGLSLIIVAAQGAYLLDMRSPTSPPKLLVRGQSIAAAALSPDGKVFAAGLSPRGGAEVKIWQLGEGIHKCMYLDLQRVAPGGIVFSPTGRQLAATDGQGGIQVLDLQTCGRTSLRSKDTTGGLGFELAGQCLTALMLDGTQMRWCQGDMPVMKEMGNDVPLVTSANWRESSPHAIAPDGDHLALADGDQIRVQRLSAAERLLLRGFPARVVRTRFSEEGAWLLSFHEDGAVILWNLRKEEPISRTLNEIVTDTADLAGGWQEKTAIRRDGALAARIGEAFDRAAGGDMPAGLWTLELTVPGASHAHGGRRLAAWPGARGSVSLQFTPDGRLWTRAESGRVEVWHIDPLSLEKRACMLAGRGPTDADLDAWLANRRITRWVAGRLAICQ